MYTLIFHGAFGYHVCALEMSFREKASTTMYLSQPIIYLQKLTPTNPSALMFFFKKHIHNESFVWDLRNFCEPVNGEKSIWRLHTCSTTKQFRLRQRAQNVPRVPREVFSLLGCFKSARPTNTKQPAASRAGALPAVASCRRMMQVEDALDQLVAGAGANPGLCKEVCSDYFRTSSRRLGSLMATFPVIDPSWSPRLKGHDWEGDDIFRDVGQPKSKV